MVDVKRIFNVNGKPFFPVGGQALNQGGQNAKEAEVAFKAVKALNGNTLLVPVYWEQIEPEEGKFDFKSVYVLLAGHRHARGSRYSVAAIKVLLSEI